MKSKWKKLAIPGFYDRKTGPNGEIHYVRESTTRGKGNPVSVPPAEQEGTLIVIMNCTLSRKPELYTFVTMKHALTSLIHKFIINCQKVSFLNHHSTFLFEAWIQHNRENIF